MNELKVTIGCEDWIYWKTEKTNVWEAWGELQERMKGIGIDVNYFHPDELVLRNANGEDIDGWEV